MNNNLIYTETAAMTPDEWERMRQRLSTIGGSDAATVLGVNPYSSPYSLWCQKTGKIAAPDLSDKEAVRLGHDLEDYVAARWCERTGKKVRRRNAVIHNPDYPFAHANLDRVVVGEDAVLEIKTTSSWTVTKQCRDGNVPTVYYCQCVHYLAVTGAQRCYLAVLCFGSGLYCFTVERDEAEIDALMTVERKFSDMVSSDTPPSADGSEATTDALNTIYAESAPGKAIDLTAVGQHIELYNVLCDQIRSLSQDRDRQENIIKAYMGDAERGAYGGTAISWKTGTRKTLDRAAYERDHGKIDDRYYKTATTRTFRAKRED